MGRGKPEIAKEEARNAYCKGEGSQCPPFPATIGVMVLMGEWGIVYSNTVSQITQIINSQQHLMAANLKGVRKPVGKNKFTRKGMRGGQEREEGGEVKF